VGGVGEPSVAGMSSLSIQCRRPAGLPAGVLNSALVSLAAFAFTAEWAAVAGRPVLIAVDLAVGVAGLAVFLLTRLGRVGVALGLSALLVVSAALTPVAAAAALWVARRRPLPAALAVAATGIGAHLLRATWRPEPGSSLLTWLAVLVASYAAVIAWGAHRRLTPTR
jgi:hypothetical protein